MAGKSSTTTVTLDPVASRALTRLMESLDLLDGPGPRTHPYPSPADAVGFAVTMLLERVTAELVKRAASEAYLDEARKLPKP